MMQIARLRISAVLVTAAAVLFSASLAPASPEGHVAADQVSQGSYMGFMDSWLYTHNGDSRGPGGAELLLARDNIYFLMDSFGLTVTLEPFTYGGGTYHNVVATQLGSVYPDQEYIVGAHYDSVSNPGADDNASGVALVLEAARILSQYDSAYTIRYVAFSMEEVGLVGSNAYVSAHAGDDILAMISTDMVAYDPGTDAARIYSQAASAGLRDALGAAVGTYGDGLTWFDAGWTNASDHAPFSSAGYQAALLIESEVWSNPHYHQPEDSFDTPGYLNFPYAVKMTRSVVGWLVDQAEVAVDFEGLGFTYSDGQPELIDPDGGTVMRVEVYGVGGAVPQPGTANLHFDTGAGWQSMPMDVVSDNVYDAVFPAGTCGESVRYYFSAEAVGGAVYSDPWIAPVVSFAAKPSYGHVVWLEEYLDTDPGWTTEGEWEFGQPTGGGGASGGPDPTSGYTGNNVYGYNLDGDYPNNLPQTHLITTPIDCSDLYDARLKFWRWLGVQGAIYDRANVWVSSDGIEWTRVWFHNMEPPDEAWVFMDLDISEVADGQPTVFLRWTMGTTNATQTYCGWNIDDVQIVGTDCTLPYAVIDAARSCLDHGDAGELCLELDSANIEPRADGVQLLEFDLTLTASAFSVDIDCVPEAYAGTATVVQTGNPIALAFDPALPNESCCTITLSGDANDSFEVRTVAGDVTRGGTVTTADALGLKLYFGQVADEGNCGFDYNVSGSITTADYLQLKLRYGNSAPACP